MIPIMMKMKKSRHQKIIAPLLQFSASVDPINLDGEYIIRKATSHEMDWLVKYYPSWYSKNKEQWVLCTFYKPSRVTTLDGHHQKDVNGKSRKLLETGVRLLQIFKKGNMIFNVVMVSLNQEEKPAYSFLSLRHYFPWRLEQDNLPYILKEGDIPRLQEFWKIALPNIDSFEVPAHFFAKHYIEPFYVDKIIDLVICLENFLNLKREGGFDIKSRVATRAADLISKRGSNAWQKIHKNICRSYGIRNDAMHGNLLPQLPNRSWISLAKSLRDYVRRVFRYYFGNPNHYKDISFLRSLGNKVSCT